MSRGIVQDRKDPDARLDWTIDWSDYLQDGETISTSAWAIDAPPDAVLVIASGAYAPSNTGTTATVWLTGGTLHKSYYVRNRITTSDGRIDDQTIRVFVVAM
jgi:hypothetical protein